MAFHQAVNPNLRQHIEQCFDSIRKECEGVVRFELLDNQSRTSTNYTHALFSTFTSEQALESYRNGSAHTRMMEVLSAHIAQIVVLDSTLDEG